MSIDDISSAPSLEDKFDRLAVQAEREIAKALIAAGKETDLSEAEILAEQMFEGRCNEAGGLFDEYVDRIEDAELSPEKRQDLLRGLFEEMEKRFVQGGYMRDITAKRLTAASIQMFEEQNEAS